MNKKTYQIIGSTLAIPNVANPNSPDGLWHAGQEVDIDTDANEVLAVRLLPSAPADAEQPSEIFMVHGTVNGVSGITEVMNVTGTDTVYSSNAYSAIYPPVAVEEATDITKEEDEE